MLVSRKASFASEEEWTAVLDAAAGDLEVWFFPAQHRMLLMFCAKRASAETDSSSGCFTAYTVTCSPSWSSSSGLPITQEVIRDMILLPLLSALPQLLLLPEMTVACLIWPRLPSCLYKTHAFATKIPEWLERAVIFWLLGSHMPSRHVTGKQRGFLAWSSPATHSLVNSLVFGFPSNCTAVTLALHECVERPFLTLPLIWFVKGKSI